MSHGITDSPGAQGRLAKQDSDAQALNVAALRAVMETAPGRRVLWWLIEYANVFGPTNWGEGADYRAGRRDFGVEVLRLCQEASVPLYKQMLLDRVDEQETEALLKKAAQEQSDG